MDLFVSGVLVVVMYYTDFRSLGTFSWAKK